MIFFSKLFNSKKQKLTEKDFLNGLKCEFKLLYKHKEKCRITNYKKKFSHSKYQKNYIKKIISKKVNLIKNSNFNLEKTQSFLDKKISTFNGIIENNQYLSNIDYIIFEKDNIYIYNLNYLFSLKKIFFQKLAFQKLILDSLNIKVDKFFAFYIDKSYLLEENLQEDLLLKKVEVTENVNNIYLEVKEKAEKFYQLLNQKFIFSTKEFQYCTSKKKCDYIDICNPKIKNTDIFNLIDSSHQVDELFDNNITKIHEINDLENFNEKAKIQIKSVKNSIIYINKKKINHFLSLIKYPIYFLDFECFSSLIPIYKKSYPSQHIPFQYSLHYQENEKSELKHFSYLNQLKEIDPRKKILEKLSKKINQSCTIICYNIDFEKKCLRESTEVFKEYKDWFKKIENQFLDLAHPFSNLDYYHYKQNGSTSLKTILPLITKLSYEDLEINKGYDASLLYLKTITEKVEEEEKKKIYRDLEKYCYLDTYALFEILKELREITSN